MATPSWLDLPRHFWLNFLDQYTTHMKSPPNFQQRVFCYYHLFLIWWALRLERALYEIPLGQDDRLATRPPNWTQQLETNRQRYYQLLHTLTAP
ncbi:MAG TPA: hypothetical protein VLL52_10020 [Anaerolineae bacterium]|nr:hypothetical protein [Anaerolineae bacterium]